MRRIFFALFLVFLTLPTLAASNVADLAKRYRDLRLGEGRLAANLSFAIGHARFTVASGTAAPVMAGDEQIGVYILGAGTFVYETVDKDEFPVVRHNTRTNGIKLQTAADKLTIQQSFKGVFIWGHPLPELGTAAGVTPNGEFERHRQFFTRQSNYAPEHLFAARALDAPSAQVVRAEIDGTDDSLVYVFDSAFAQTERLLRLYKLGSVANKMKHMLFVAGISQQPVGRKSREEAPPRVMLTHVDIDLTASEKDDATLRVKETLVPKRPVSVIGFDLYTEYWYDFDRDPRRYNVRSVKDKQGNELPFVHNADELLISLPSVAAVGKSIDLQFEIDGNFLYRPGGDNYWELGIEPWFPQTAWNEQAYTYHGVVRVKKPFVPFSPGKTIRREVEGDYNVVETTLEQPVSFVAILAGKYHFEEYEQNGVKIRVANYAGKDLEASKQLANIAYSAIEYFPTFLGPFPFSELNIIEKNELGYGQAPPATVFITREIFTPKHRDANQFVELVNMRFAHEIAHQYWAHVVKMPSPEEQWLTEAFAEYSAALFMRAAGRKVDYDKSFARWKADAKQATERATIPTANRLSNPDDSMSRRMDRFGLMYGKGPLLLAALHQQLGDQAFMTFLKSYQRSFRWKFGTTEDVAGLLQFMTKKDWNPFFEQYFYGTAMPEVKR